MDGNGTSTAILVGVWATFALDVFSTLNSSPQTAEINIGRRKQSLMYWVVVASIVGVGGGIIATTKSGKAEPLIATIAVSAGMFLLYKHAARRGEARNGEPGTEDAGPVGWPPH